MCWLSIMLLRKSYVRRTCLGGRKQAFSTFNGLLARCQVCGSPRHWCSRQDICILQHSLLAFQQHIHSYQTHTDVEQTIFFKKIHIIHDESFIRHSSSLGRAPSLTASTSFCDSRIPDAYVYRHHLNDGKWRLPTQHTPAASDKRAISNG